MSIPGEDTSNRSHNLLILLCSFQISTWNLVLSFFRDTNRSASVCWECFIMLLHWNIYCMCILLCQNKICIFCRIFLKTCFLCFHFCLCISFFFQAIFSDFSDFFFFFGAFRSMLFAIVITLWGWEWLSERERRVEPGRGVKQGISLTSLQRQKRATSNFYA